MRRPPPIAHRLCVCARIALILLAVLPVATVAEEARRNVFDDPFVQLSSAIPPSECPAPSGPLMSEAEARAQAHGRIERGTSCFQSGRCRLPNAYLYDKEIMPRVQKAVAADGRFAATTSVWALGQRRWIWLQGCVRSADEASALEALVKQIDDVEFVVNELKLVPGASASPASGASR
ncbi:BON domain-containing protein [Roseateles chitinivorans]|uniref:BON domain-containing protein n=1 Tax=Roseateles chitinivorans TaxID=2917965 RepID=UPI003D66C4DD